MHIGHINPKARYKLNANLLLLTAEERELEILISDDLKGKQAMQ